MKLKPNRLLTLTLTPALSPGERENRSPSRCATEHGGRSKDSRASQSVRLLFPLPGGEGQGEGGSIARVHAFTLIELILVMALLAIVLAISAPSLSRFFHSRGLDNEAQRFMALTRAAQSRAISEGVPMVVWFDTKQRAYGLNADKSFVEQDAKAQMFNLEDTVEVEARYSAEANAAAKASQFKNERLDSASLYTLRFNPDGFISPGSPEMVVFRQKDNGELWVVQSRNRLHYEIQPGNQIASR